MFVLYVCDSVLVFLSDDICVVKTGRQMMICVSPKINWENFDGIWIRDVVKLSVQNVMECVAL